MFVQVLRARVADREGLKAAVERWRRDLAPGATGWLGSTAGVTDDGELVAIVRFESEADLRRSTARPEQDEWWQQMRQYLAGDATFRESGNGESDLHGNPDLAGFVQVMEGRSRDPERARALMQQNREARAAFRPDVIGTFVTTFDDGGFVMSIYFRSEEEARGAEGKEPPPELRAEMEEMGTLMDGVPSFFDLRDPWLHSPD